VLSLPAQSANKGDRAITQWILLSMRKRSFSSFIKIASHRYRFLNAVHLTRVYLMSKLGLQCEINEITLLQRSLLGLQNTVTSTEPFSLHNTSTPARVTEITFCHNKKHDKFIT